MSILRPALLFFGLAILPLLGTAQILNIEDVRTRRDTTKAWAGSLGVDFTLNNRSATPANPVQFINIATRANLARFGKEHAIWLINVLNYSAITGNAFIRTGYSHLRFTYGLEKKLGFEVFGQGQYDLGRGLKARWLGGIGGRYNLVRDQKVALHAGVGLMYEWENWQHPVEGNEVSLGYLKSTNYLSLQWRIKDVALFHITNYYQVGYDKPLRLWRHRLSLDAALSIKLTEKLVFRTALDAGYESAPIVPIFKTVYTLTNGLELTF